MDLIAAAVSAEAGEAYSRLLGVVVLLGSSFGALVLFAVSLVKASRQRTRGWMISAAISGLAMLGSLTWAVSLAAETLAGTAKEENAVRPPSELSSSDGKVSIKIPGSWMAMPELHPAAVIAAGDKSQEQYAMVLSTDRASFPTSVSDFEIFVTEGLKAALEDSKVAEPRMLEVGGYKAIRRSISGMRAGQRIAYEQVVIETRSTYFQLLMWTVFSHRSAAQQEFRDIIASFAAEAGPPLPE